LQAKLEWLTKSQIEAKTGEYDDDEFFILADDKGFYDPMGFYFGSAGGKDALGGKYNDEGYYEGPEGAAEARESIMKLNLLREERDSNLEYLTRTEIEALNLGGKYDEDDFYLCEDGSFYDPLGYFFDKDGFDGVFGFYDDQGYYVAPDEEYDQNENGDSEDEQEDAQDA